MSMPAISKLEGGSRIVVVSVSKDADRGDQWHLIEQKDDGQVWSYKLRLESAVRLRESGPPLMYPQGNSIPVDSHPSLPEAELPSAPILSVELPQSQGSPSSLPNKISPAPFLPVEVPQLHGSPPSLPMGESPAPELPLWQDWRTCPLGRARIDGARSGGIVGGAKGSQGSSGGTFGGGKGSKDSQGSGTFGGCKGSSGGTFGVGGRMGSRAAAAGKVDGWWHGKDNSWLPDDLDHGNAD
jgi:hypothetical protein